jgi:hypothetical protein
MRKAVDKAKDIIDTPKKVASAIDDKIKSPIMQAKSKAESPFEAMKAKQSQAKSLMDAQKKQVDSAAKLFAMSQLLFMDKRDGAGSTISESKSQADKSKDSIAEKEQDYQSKGNALQQLMEKIAKGELK